MVLNPSRIQSIVDPGHLPPVKPLGLVKESLQVVRDNDDFVGRLRGESVQKGREGMVAKSIVVVLSGDDNGYPSALGGQSAVQVGVDEVGMDEVIVALPYQLIEPPNQQGVYIPPDEHLFDLDTAFLEPSDVVIEGLVSFHKKDNGDLVFGLVQALQ